MSFFSSAPALRQMKWFDEASLGRVRVAVRAARGSVEDAPPGRVARASRFEVGARVRHAKFGRGVVTGVDAEGRGAVVRFDDQRLARISSGFLAEDDGAEPAAARTALVPTCAYRVGDRVSHPSYGRGTVDAVGDYNPRRRDHPLTIDFDNSKRVKVMHAAVVCSVDEGRREPLVVEVAARELAPLAPEIRRRVEDEWNRSIEKKSAPLGACVTDDFVDRPPPGRSALEDAEPWVPYEQKVAEGRARTVRSVRSVRSGRQTGSLFAAGTVVERR